uniref:alpha/beta hydrolase n=1 Tax=Bradyrhizobium sp. (strain ORS 278) TaxID=114615 RepID=UPI001566A96A|nr:alpha/beta hydrolase [Bradyrhizobium sp. ORS 278]
MRGVKMVLRLVGWGLGLAGVLALILGAMLANPLVHPPELKSISETAGQVDRSTMPPLQRFSARDGTELAYRHYPARGTPAGKIAILVHGSSGSSVAVHALADGLAAGGIETFAPDIRGHGGSGTRGDIGYRGQLENDLADLVAEVRRSVPTQPIVLLGHSAGGGFALRVAGSPIQDLFARTVLLAPYLGYDAPTNRDNSGGWASPDIPRILALGLLSRAGLPCCEALPALAFAIRPNAEKYVVPAYSYRLFRNFATAGYKADLIAAKHPVSVIAGAADELMLADKYADAVHAVAPAVDVKLVAGVNHMEIVSAPAAVAAIAEDVATR